MQNNSKPPLQTQPSTLDIVLKNGQMNLATAIGRLEQAVSKAYGNINSSINSKQGEFNQALLKTLDQSISKSSNKMDQFYTSSFAKIYALNSILMEQSLKKNGMAFAQKDLEGYRNLDKVFDNQQRAFGDMNIALRQIIEKMTPKTPYDVEKEMMRINNFSQSHDVQYKDVATYLKISARHNVDKEVALNSFGNIKKDFFDNRKKESFSEIPLIKSLTANNKELLKELQGTSNISDFITILIESLSKAKTNNKDAVKKLHEYVKDPDVEAVLTDSGIHRLTPEEKKDKNKRNQNILYNIQKDAKTEQKANDRMVERGYYDNQARADGIDHTQQVKSRVRVYSGYLDGENKEKIEKYNTDRKNMDKAALDDSVSQQFDYESSHKSWYQAYKKTLEGVPLGGLLYQISEQNDKNMWRKKIEYNTQGDSDIDAEPLLINRSVYKVNPIQNPSEYYKPNNLGFYQFPLSAQTSTSDTILEIKKFLNENSVGKGYTSSADNHVTSQSVVMKKPASSSLPDIQNKNSNLLLAKQLLNTPNIMQQRLNINIALTQNGIGKTEYSVEKNISIPRKGNGSPVVIDHAFPQWGASAFKVK